MKSNCETLTRSVYCSRCSLQLVSESLNPPCPKCAGSLELIVDLGRVNPGLKTELRERPANIWRWKEFLPQVKQVVTLGEGGTPFVHSPRLAAHAGIERLYFKAEYALPTGSLKDRSVAVAVSDAVSLGQRSITVASTGNHAASVAAYAAAAGLQAFIFVPEGVDPSKLRQMNAYGAKVLSVRGTFKQTGHLMMEAVKNFGWYPCVSGNPVRNEGKKTCAFEVWEDLGRSVPDVMIHPIAGGIGLWAAWKGWRELERVGWTTSIPRMVGAQAELVAPIAEAWARSLTNPVAVLEKSTCAESIAVGSVTEGVGYRTLEAIRESNGDCVASSDQKILEARALLGTLGGMFVEPAAAVAFAAALDLKAKGKIKSNDVVVCVLTGHGFKQTVSEDSEQTISIEPSLKSLESAISSRF